MNGNDCFNTPWVKELRQAVELYCVDESEDNLTRVHMVLINGIYRNEKLPLAGIDLEGYFTASEDSICLLYSNLFPQEDYPGTNGVTMSECLALIIKNKLDGLLLVTEHGNFPFSFNDLLAMFEALHGKMDVAGTEEEDEEPAPEEPSEGAEMPNTDEDEPEPKDNGSAFDLDGDELPEDEVMMSDFLVRRPLPKDHFEPIHDALSNALLPGGGKVIVRFANYYSDDEMMAILAVPVGDHFHVSTLYSMDDFGWNHPLVLGNDVGTNTTCDLFRALCCTDKQSGALSEMSHFRDETKRFYGKD